MGNYMGYNFQQPFVLFPSTKSSQDCFRFPQPLEASILFKWIRAIFLSYLARSYFQYFTPLVVVKSQQEFCSQFPGPRSALSMPILRQKIIIFWNIYYFCFLCNSIYQYRASLPWQNIELGINSYSGLANIYHSSRKFKGFQITETIPFPFQIFH